MAELRERMARLEGLLEGLRESIGRAVARSVIHLLSDIGLCLTLYR